MQFAPSSPLPSAPPMRAAGADRALAGRCSAKLVQTAVRSSCTIAFFMALVQLKGRREPVSRRLPRVPAAGRAFSRQVRFDTGGGNARAAVRAGGGPGGVWELESTEAIKRASAKGSASPSSPATRSARRSSAASSLSSASPARLRSSASCTWRVSPGGRSPPANAASWRRSGAAARRTRRTRPAASPERRPWSQRR